MDEPAAMPSEQRQSTTAAGSPLNARSLEVADLVLKLFAGPHSLTRFLSLMNGSRLEYPHVDDPALPTFATIAADFCDLVEGYASLEPLTFVHRLHLLVSDLYAAGLRLPSIDVLYEDDGADEDDEANDDESYEALPPDADRLRHEDWRELSDRLSDVFGEYNYYREVFDPWEPVSEHPEVTGSVADDIADVYLEVRTGLVKWRRGETGAALWTWRFGLEHHWGEHVTGAIRALHTRATWHDSGLPRS